MVPFPDPGKESDKRTAEDREKPGLDGRGRERGRSQASRSSGIPWPGTPAWVNLGD